ncbi:MAG: hypothetical protein IJ141_00735 [Lachnospiraceae bacterium]|nr:hypothetical protein [Lachnospiraceae bacterium]
MLNNILKRILAFFEEKPQFVYPVLIGSNGISIRDEVVNSAFEKLYRLYEDWYYEYSFYSSQNVVVYQFRVYNYKLSDKFDRKLVIHRAKQIAERALQMHFHDNGIYGTAVDGFIAVTLYSDVLRIHIACNNIGFREIEAIRLQSK